MAVAGVGLGLAYSHDAAAVTQSAAFYALRWLAGLVGVAVTTFMTWETLKIPNTQSATGILYVGVILVFIPALGTFLISDLLGGPDSQLIGNVIERQFKSANNLPLGAAMSFILLYLTFIFLALRAWLGGREAAHG